MKPNLPRGSAVFAAGTVLLLAATLVGLQALGAGRAEESIADLSLVTSLRSSNVRDELEKARSDALLWSSFGGIIQRLTDLEEAWLAMGPNAGTVLERLYVRENPFPETERFLLMDPDDGSPYSVIHAEFQSQVREFLEVHGYDDLLLLTPSGRVVYSFRKEEDFGADLLTERWQETPLAQVARAASALGPGIPTIADFEPYEPRGGDWALFIGAPVHGAGSLAEGGAFVLRLSPEHIGRQLVRSDQQRETASSMILGDKYRILDHPPWIEEASTDDPVEQEVRSLARESTEGAVVLRDRDGNEVLTVWETVTFEGIRWVVSSQAELDEVRAEGAGERVALWVTTFLIWLSLGVLTLGRQETSILGRHRI
jgi:methyl-accepting chemotaxis protein